jgi:cytochrome P450
MLMAAVDGETGTAMTDPQMLDEMVTFLLTGHETITNSLLWTFQLLSLHPDIRRRLEEEVDLALGGRSPSPDDLDALPLCRRIIEESLRLYPPAWGFVRWTDKATEVGGYRIPAHCSVCISPYLIHRHTRYWSNPEGFDPDRFLPERCKECPKFVYIPFGGGPRVCIGNHFAIMEAMIIVASVTQRVRLNLLPGHKLDPEALVTLCVRNGLKMTVEPRVRSATTLGLVTGSVMAPPGA